MKRCNKCGVEKNETEFWKDKSHKDGLCSSCKDCKKECQREYQKTDKGKECNRERRKTEEYKAYQRTYQREYQKKRVATNPKFKLDSNMATAIWTALKGKKAGRKWESLVEYTIDDLIKHLESKFEDWMNWGNYGNKEGKWTIDHIKPKSLFSYESPDDEEFKRCWALNNLQPLEFIENIKKSDKY